MIHAGFSDLKRAFYKHEVLVLTLNDTSSAYLLLFYAVECGLKSIYIRRNSHKTTNDLPENIRSHDLALLAKELRLPAYITGALPVVRFGKANTSCTIDKVHQLWRYGILVDKADQQKIVSWLTEIYLWIKDNINQ